MLREVTAENIAMQDKILHEIQLLSAIYELKYTTNQYENKLIYLTCRHSARFILLRKQERRL